MAEVSSHSSHSSLLSRGSSSGDLITELSLRSGPMDPPSGPVSLPEPLQSSRYRHQSSQEGHCSSSPLHQFSVEKQPSQHSSREKLQQSNKEKVPSSPSERRIPVHILAGPSVVTASNWSPTVPKTIKGCSSATLENCRYKLGAYPQSDHENEDRYFTMDTNNVQVFGVFDGHDGSRAVGFVSNYIMELFKMTSWNRAVETGQHFDLVFEEFFKDTENEFFKSISREIELKEIYTACIPPGMKSYQAHMEYPMEVAELQRLEPKINGGCTAVLAVIANKQLYVANVGDSRAILIRAKPDGTLYAQQLSVDHCVENEDELTRLERLGLNRDNLKRAGRLGMHENTRSIGDYYVKQGYKDVDTLASAREPPGIAIPHIATPVTIDQTVRYLVLMTDGVYKSIEGQFANEGAVEANKVLTATIDREDSLGSNPALLADSVLARISKLHQQAYQTAAAIDPRSTVAVNCRKRDDMTCVIYKFLPPVPVPRKRPQLQISTEQSYSAPPSLADD